MEADIMNCQANLKPAWAQLMFRLSIFKKYVTLIFMTDMKRKFLVLLNIVRTSLLTEHILVV